ncbi:hypothetical protein BDQ17DRAFT_1547060 [Cyathus striatus]|nr:hypothetical protein BDQ17DRAFT_1547060 [Cyathus striatus]
MVNKPAWDPLNCLSSPLVYERKTGESSCMASRSTLHKMKDEDEVSLGSETGDPLFLAAFSDDEGDDWDNIPGLGTDTNRTTRSPSPVTPINPVIPLPAMQFTPNGLLPSPPITQETTGRAYSGGPIRHTHSPTSISVPVLSPSTRGPRQKASMSDPPKVHCKDNIDLQKPGPRNNVLFNPMQGNRKPSTIPTSPRKDFPSSVTSMASPGSVSSLGSSGSMPSTSVAIESAQTAAPSRSSTNPSSSTESLSNISSPSNVPHANESGFNIPKGGISIQIENCLYRPPVFWLTAYSARCNALLRSGKAKSGNRDRYGNSIYKLDRTGIKKEEFEELIKLNFPDKPVPFSKIAKLLHASIKLDVSMFIDWGKTALPKMWPADFTDISATPLPGAHHAVFFAKRFLLPTVHKRAMYELVRAPEFKQYGDDGKIMSFKSPDRGPGLSLSDYKCLVRVQRDLSAYWLPIAARPSLKLKERPTCRSKSDKCAVMDSAKMDDIDRNVSKELGLLTKFKDDPVCGLYEIHKFRWDNQGFCDTCSNSWRLSFYTDAKNLWASLNFSDGLT